MAHQVTQMRREIDEIRLSWALREAMGTEEDRKEAAAGPGGGFDRFRRSEPETMQKNPGILPPWDIISLPTSNPLQRG